MPPVPETLTPRTFTIPTPEGPMKMERTWTDAQIDEILGAALHVVDRLAPAEDLRLEILKTAVNMVGQMSPKDAPKLAVAPATAIDALGRKG